DFHVTGVQTCALPIYGTLLGTFGVYSGEAREPQAIEIDMLTTFSYLSGLAIERSRHEEEIQFLANHDALTNLPNLRYFKEVFSRSEERRVGKECRTIW